MTEAKRAGNRAYERRSSLQAVTIRLGPEARERLDRLEKIYGGKRQAAEAALKALDEQHG